MAKSKNNSPASIETVAAQQTGYEDLIAGFVSDSGGFPPYFKFENDGDCLMAKVAGLDATDPEFPRIIMECVGKPLTCRKGPVNDSVEAVVEVGEFFTLTQYASIPFELYLDIPVFLQRTAEQPQKKDPKKSTILFNIQMTPEDKKVVNERRKETSALQLAAARRTFSSGAAQLPSA
jgi:hypothetical protein